MEPGTYLQKRREAAGLAIDDVARMMAPASPHARGRVAADLTAIERGGALDPRLALGLVEELRTIFRFDPTVYHALAAHAVDPDSELPLPNVCRLCGCSWNDPCEDPDRGPCAWADAEQDLCTRCLQAAAVAAAAIAPAPGAGR